MTWLGSRRSDRAVEPWRPRRLDAQRHFLSPVVRRARLCCGFFGAREWFTCHRVRGKNCGERLRTVKSNGLGLEQKISWIQAGFLEKKLLWALAETCFSRYAKSKRGKETN
jgi:hypothetical protein